MSERCPKCGDEVAYRWLGIEPGSRIPARCMKLDAQLYGRLPADVTPCDWTGHVERGADGAAFVVAQHPTTIDNPGIVLRYSGTLKRRIAQIMSGGRPEEQRITSAVVRASPDGRTVQTHSGSLYRLTGHVLLQRHVGGRVEHTAAESPIRWDRIVDGVELLEVTDAGQ